jgi:hypothetical protein
MPDPRLAPNEQVLHNIKPARQTYNKEHLMLFALGAVLMAGILFAVGNPFPWTGVVGAAFAIFIRWFYVASEAMDVVWVLTNQRLTGPSERSVPLNSIKTVRTIFSAVQVVTNSGDKYMIKYLPDPDQVATRILAARDGASR